jgi:class 3 adenylate cyclase/pimeloyl-ACP methyl ester carboxylesterase
MSSSSPRSTPPTSRIIWEWPPAAQFLRAFSTRGRLLIFDRRGTGLSDGVNTNALPSLEVRMDDIRAVMDAASSKRAVLYGQEDGAAQCFLFAATYPERVSAIITWAAAARGSWAPDHPWGWGDAEWDEWLSKVEAGWGTASFEQETASWLFPSNAGNAEFVRAYGRLLRHSLSPGAALSAERMFRELDVRHVLPAVQAPTLVLQPAEGQLITVDEGRYIVENIPSATFVELPGGDFSSVMGSFSHIDRFLASVRDEEAEFDRVLATVLFTDIVGSTDRAAALGDRKWRELLEQHHAKVRALIGRYRGTEIDTAGDGFLATFDGPARGVRCAQAISEAVRPLGLEIRAGLHTGEVETIDGKVGGIAVHIGARVGALAEPSQVFVSQTVKDLVAGSGLTFEDAGEHELKGVPDHWHLYRVVS